MSERMTARKRQALEMRSRIQSAALDLFDREGFENVSVEEIAQTAGCSVGNIYHYFKSKDELAIQVTSHVDDAYSELEEAYLADTARPAREKLLDFVGRSLEISVSDPVLYKAFKMCIRDSTRWDSPDRWCRTGTGPGAGPRSGAGRRGPSAPGWPGRHRCYSSGPGWYRAAPGSAHTGPPRSCRCV